MAGESQMDAFRDNPAHLAEVWRVAAIASREQFPNDHGRHAYYDDHARSWARKAKEQAGEIEVTP